MKVCEDFKQECASDCKSLSKDGLGWNRPWCWGSQVTSFDGEKASGA